MASIRGWICLRRKPWSDTSRRTSSVRRQRSPLKANAPRGRAARISRAARCLLYSLMHSPYRPARDMKKTTIKLNFPTGHLGASGSDDSLTLVIRALSLKHGEKDSWADKYGADYEDDVICIHHDVQHPECSCDYEPQEKAWLVENAHADDCFVSVCGVFVADIEKQHPLPDYEFFQVMDDADMVDMLRFWHDGPGPTEEQKVHTVDFRRSAERDFISGFASSDIFDRAKWSMYGALPSTT